MLWNLRRISHFVAVAEATSLSKAARLLKMSQPALTASIRKLEEELGVALFDRKAGFAITPLGSELLPRAREALARMADLEREVQLLQEAEVGELRVGCGPTMADSLVGPAVARLIRRRPNLCVSVMVREYHELPAFLKQRSLDLVIADRSLIGNDPELTVVPVEDQPIVLFCRKGHPLDGKRAVSSRELFSYPLVSTPLPPWAVAWLKSQAASGEAPPRLTVECSHHATLKAVVEGSDAVSGAPYAAIEAEVKTGRLAVVDLKAPPLFSQAGIVHLANRTLSPAANLMIEELVRPEGPLLSRQKCS